MYTLKSKILPVFTTGIFGGGILAFVFINPYGEKILLSEAVLQLSGSSGEFPLMPGFKDLISFTMKMLPDYIFEMYIGIELYRHFCTASVYVFSRTPYRIRWYLKETAKVAAAIILYQIIKMFTAIIVTSLRSRTEADRTGLLLLVFHIIIYSMWVFTVSLLLNFIAVKIGSNPAFMWIGGLQLILTALLELIQIFESDPKLVKIFLNMNPIAHLVIGWHTIKADRSGSIPAAPYEGLYLGNSLFMMLGINILSLLIGMYLICRHDFLITDTGGEGD